MLALFFAGRRNLFQMEWVCLARWIFGLHLAEVAAAVAGAEIPGVVSFERKRLLAFLIGPLRQNLIIS